MNLTFEITTFSNVKRNKKNELNFFWGGVGGSLNCESSLFEIFFPFLEKNFLFESKTIVVVGVVENVCFKFVIDIIVLISKRSHYLLMRVFFELHKSSVQEI